MITKHESVSLVRRLVRRAWRTKRRHGVALTHDRLEDCVHDQIVAVLGLFRVNEYIDEETIKSTVDAGIARYLRREHRRAMREQPMADDFDSESSELGPADRLMLNDILGAVDRLVQADRALVLSITRRSDIVAHAREIGTSRQNVQQRYNRIINRLKTQVGAA